jgi:hypothetical protein
LGSLFVREVDGPAVDRWYKGLQSEREFYFLPVRDIDIWMPVSFTAQDLSNFGNHNLTCVGRLKNGVTFAQGSVAGLVRCASRFCIPALSADGRVLLYSRHVENAGWQFVRRNLNDIEERLLEHPANFSPWPFLTGKTSDSVYSRSTDAVKDRYDTVRVSETTGASSVICHSCPQFWHISPSGRCGLTMSSHNRRTIDLIDFTFGRRTELLIHPQWNLYRALFSPDEASVLHTAKAAPDRSQIFVAGFHEGRCDSEWIPITEGKEYNAPAQWSPSGDVIYFTSTSDGHRCFYMRGWDRRAHRPSGPVRVVRHFHASSPSTGLIPQAFFGFAVSPDKLVCPMAERRGSIWLVH